jgi:hypothetical protein
MKKNIIFILMTISLFTFGILLTGCNIYTGETIYENGLSASIDAQAGASGSEKIQFQNKTSDRITSIKVGVADNGNVFASGLDSLSNQLSSSLSINSWTSDILLDSSVYNAKWIWFKVETAGGKSLCGSVAWYAATNYFVYITDVE